MDTIHAVTQIATTDLAQSVVVVIQALFLIIGAIMHIFGKKAS